MTQAVAIVSKNLHKILQITKKLVSKITYLGMGFAFAVKKKAS